MGKDDSPKKDSFNAALEDAVDNLFSQYEQSTPSDSGGSSPQEEQAEVAELSLEPSTTLDPSGEPSESFEKIYDLLNQLNQALLTIEWEIDKKTVLNARSLLEQIRAELSLETSPRLTELIDLIDLILKGLADAPHTVPTTGPKAMEKGLAVLREAARQGKKTDENTIPALTDALALLQNSRPTGEGELELSIESIAPEAPTHTPLPSSLIKILTVHEAVLGKITTRIVQLEKLFAQKPGYDKLYSIYTELRQLLEKQTTTIAHAKHGDFRVSSDTASQPQEIDPDIPPKMAMVILQHGSILKKCINRLAPIETLFSKTAGYEKLHTLHLQLRELFQKNIQGLALALTGNYTGAMQSLTAVTTTAPQAAKVTKAAAQCPWDRLVTARWQGKTVAFIPSELACERVASKWTRKNLLSQQRFPLKKLKAWPWSKISPQLQGQLAGQPEGTLKSLLLPVLSHPEPVQNVINISANPVLLILYINGKGGVVLLDNGTTSVNISEQNAWRPVIKQGTLLAGHVDIQGEKIPVITLAECGECG